MEPSAGPDAARTWHPAVLLAVSACALYVLQRVMVIWLQGQGHQFSFVLNNYPIWTVGTGLLFTALALLCVRHRRDLLVPRIVGAIGLVGMIHAALGGIGFAAGLWQGDRALRAYAAVALLADVLATGALAMTWVPGLSKR